MATLPPSQSEGPHAASGTSMLVPRSSWPQGSHFHNRWGHLSASASERPGSHGPFCLCPLLLHQWPHPLSHLVSQSRHSFSLWDFIVEFSLLGPRLQTYRVTGQSLELRCLTAPGNNSLTVQSNRFFRKSPITQRFLFKHAAKP